MNFIKKGFAFVLALIIFICPLVICKADNTNYVSASVSFEWPPMPYVSNVPQNFSMTDSLEALADNSSLSSVDLDSCRVFFKYNVNPQMYDIFVVPSDQIVEAECKTFFYYERTYSMVKFMSGYKTYCPYSAFASTTFSPFTQVDNTSFGSVDTWGCVHITDGLNSVPYLVVPFYVNMDRGGAYDSAELTVNLGTGFADFSVPFDTIYEEIALPFFSLESDDFYDWIINNNKIGQLPVYIVQSKLKSFIEFYKQFGSSNTFFASKIGDWFNHMNIASQSMSNISALKTSIDKLYAEYLDYRSSTHAYWPSATKIQERSDIDTITDNNNLTLVTDDSNDTIDITILRDILRGVVAISNNIIEGSSKVVQKLDEMNFTVQLSNDGGYNKPDLSQLWTYNANSFDDDLQNFEYDISVVQTVPMGYISSINQNALMPENMLQDKESLTVNLPTITGFTVNNNGSTYSTQTGTYTLKSTDYPWLDLIVKKIKRFASILLIIGYLVHLRFRIPELVRGE